MKWSSTPRASSRPKNFTPVEFQAVARHPVLGEGEIQVPFRAHPEPEDHPESMIVREDPQTSIPRKNVVSGGSANEEKEILNTDPYQSSLLLCIQSTENNS